MAKEDFEWMKRLGLNVLRLGVLWSGVEPTRGNYNETYLDELDAIVALAAAHGVYTFLDWHQDGISEHFCGEGAPAWAIRRAERPQFQYPWPFAAAFNQSSQFYEEPRLGGSPTIPTRRACGTSHGPGWGEATREEAQAYQAIYSNWQGVGDAFAAAQARVAARFARRPEVLGIELLNEPFAGDYYEDPLIMVPFPNPKNADAKNLQPLYDRISAAIRAVDEGVLLFFGGTTWDDLGVGFTAPPGGAEYANRSVVAYHYYAPPQVSVPLQFAAYRRAAQRLQTGGFMTESDHAPGREVAVGDVGDGADGALQSWATWEWKNFFHHADGDVSQMAAWGASKTGCGSAWPGRAPTAEFQRGYARTYASAIAGEATSMYFNVTSGAFRLEYVVTQCTGTSVRVATDVFVWPERYPGGAAVTATANVGSVRVDYNGTGSSTVLIYPNADVPCGARIIVSIIRKE